MCNKKRYDSREEAEYGFKYAISKGYIPNEKYIAYSCDDCFGWHFGHPSNYDNGLCLRSRAKKTGRKTVKKNFL